MKVKVFDEEHEDDLTYMINKFIKDYEIEIIDIKFSCSVNTFHDEQIYCFSALILYE